MEVSMSEIIRETRNAINARLDMLESLMKLSNKSGNLNEFTQRLERIESMLSYNDNIKARFPNVELEEQIPQVIIMEKQYSYEDSTNTNSPIHYNSPVQENTSMPNDASSLHALDNDSDKEEEEVMEEEEEEEVVSNASMQRMSAAGIADDKGDNTTSKACGEADDKMDDCSFNK